jgi:hypothetical protein
MQPHDGRVGVSFVDEIDLVQDDHVGCNELPTTVSPT